MNNHKRTPKQLKLVKIPLVDKFPNLGLKIIKLLRKRQTYDSFRVTFTVVVILSLLLAQLQFIIQLFIKEHIKLEAYA